MKKIKNRRKKDPFEREANAFFNEYYALTGKDFPPFDRSKWPDLEEWLVDLKVAVYREQAIKVLLEEGNNTCGASDFPEAV